jgi:hypothetical protein
MNEYITLTNADMEKVTDALLEYMDEQSASIFIRNVVGYEKIMTEEECFKKESDTAQDGTDPLGFLIGGANYYINLKKTTLILLAFMMDLKLTKGASSLMLNLMGVNFATIQKLGADNGEKCIVCELIHRKGKLNDVGTLLFGRASCINNHLLCRFRDEGRCGLKDGELMSIIDGLVKRGLFTFTEGRYAYNL